MHKYFFAAAILTLLSAHVPSIPEPSNAPNLLHFIC